MKTFSCRNRYDIEDIPVMALNTLMILYIIISLIVEQKLFNGIIKSSIPILIIGLLFLSVFTIINRKLILNRLNVNILLLIGLLLIFVIINSQFAKASSLVSRQTSCVRWVRRKDTVQIKPRCVGFKNRSAKKRTWNIH